MFFSRNASFGSNRERSRDTINVFQEDGLAVLIAVIAVSIFSVLGLFLTVNATTEVRISDNHEAEVRAHVAAMAGINHARELIRGLDHNSLLRGPNGVGDSTYPSTQSGQYAFRNWITWDQARAFNILNPAASVSGFTDDGLINTGKSGASNGTALIPDTGVAMTATNPYASGTLTTARYFVKVTDDPEDGDGDPFTDSNDIVIVRSTGIAQTVREMDGGVVRANSVAVYEAKFKRLKTFDLDAPVVLQGDPVGPAKPNMFNGNAFHIEGGSQEYGIGTIDTNLANGSDPSQQVMGNLDSNQYDNIDGTCCTGNTPAVGDVTPQPGDSNYNLMDPNYVYNFMFNDLWRFANAYYQGDQSWAGGSAPYLGHYDPTKDRYAPGQDYRITYVKGDLSLSGNLEGGGILAVTGSLSGTGSLKWNGLILVIGEGVANLSGMNVSITGGLYVVNVSMLQGVATFGSPQFTISGRSNIVADDGILNLSVDTLPSKQISLREVTSIMDP